MWFIFLISCIAIALAALVVVWVGNAVYLSIRKHNRQADIEDAACDSAAKVIKKSVEKE